MDPVVALADRVAIGDVLARYCRGLDRCDEELVASAFHPDAVDEHSYVVLSGAEIAPYLVNRMRSTFTSTLHCLLQSSVEVDADMAWAETYFVAWLSAEVAGEQVVDQACGRYIDRLERRDGDWKIAKRVALPEVLTRVGTQTETLRYVSATPQRSRRDPSYSRVL